MRELGDIGSVFDHRFTQEWGKEGYKTGPPKKIFQKICLKT